MPSSDVVELVRRSGGVVARKQLRTRKLRAASDHAVAEGSLVVLARKWVALPAAVTAAREAQAAGGILSGTSAALHHGWAVALPPTCPVVTVPRNNSHPRPHLDVRRRDVPAAQVRGHVLTPVATVVDCARTLEFGEALAVADSALRVGGVNRAALEAAVDALPARTRSKVRRVIRHADGRAANPFESMARARAIEAGLDVEAQHWIDAIRPDMTDRRRRIVIECDSYQFHASPEMFRGDARRYTQLTVAGWLVVRLVWEDVMYQPDRVRAILRAAKALGERRQGLTLA